jgi:hypothetical protein
MPFKEMHPYGQAAVLVNLAQILRVERSESDGTANIFLAEGFSAYLADPYERVRALLNGEIDRLDPKDCVPPTPGRTIG